MLSRLFAGLFGIALVALASASARADVDGIEDFYGVWVGEAVSRNLQTGEEHERDITATFMKHKRGGFQLDRIAIMLVDGQRAVPGVKRRTTEQVFIPSEGGGFYVEIPKPNPFKKAKEMRAIEGDAVRWASIEENSLLVQSFMVLDDGEFELQSLVSTIDGDRMEISFQRVMDGEVIVDLKGVAIRVE